MKLFGIVFIGTLIALRIVGIRIEVNRSAQAIGKLKNEVEMKEVAIKKYEEMINQQRNEFFGKK